MFLLPLTFSLFLSSTSAHGGIWNYSISGIWRPGIQRHWTSFSPLKNLTSPSLTCNSPGTPAEEIALLTSGSEILAYYPGWPHDIGAVLVWMAYCGPLDCKGFFPSGDDKVWFKIQQRGLQSGRVREGDWALRELVRGNYTWGTRVPERLERGAYLVRHELIALHVPWTPEFYMQCAEIFIEGEGDGVVGEEWKVGIPGVWREGDASLFLNVYEEPAASWTEWRIPGPGVWS
ncbi:glycoside hydrolase family 61 protein-like protein [Dendryphion nanum]|uniref:AA9 family lytic polysaccharide monooxygenase n=1 Tax=Dendryphion nanum TaxID=256645 RepID=A0A9P9DL70_9PLEO|nr:glycoside hydrolase family 61 protein-like protein [Dendryphion nanum]